MRYKSLEEMTAIKHGISDTARLAVLCDVLLNTNDDNGTIELRDDHNDARFILEANFGRPTRYVLNRSALLKHAENAICKPTREER